MLLTSSFVATVVINFSLYASVHSYQELYGKKETRKVYNALATLIKVNASRNIVISDKDENTVLVPPLRGKTIQISRKRNLKKYPRRTIQKIIKKVRKNRKYSMNQVTSPRTESTRYEEKQETTTTTQVTHKKKIRKWNPRFARFPRPFQKLSSRKDMHHRIRREVYPDRELYILQDLDEIRFINNEEGTNAIQAHVKNYW